MKFIKKRYYYFFYRIYHSIWRTSNAFGGESLISYKAGLAMLVLEAWILFSLMAYYRIYTKTSMQLSISMPRSTKSSSLSLANVSDFAPAK
jgi:hypothetical protein